MAGFNRKAVPLANRDALPQIPAPATYGGRPFHRMGLVLCVTGDDATSRYGFFTLPSGAIVISAWLSNDALGTAVAASFGLFETTQNGAGFAGTNAAGVANANQFFGIGVTMVTAAYRNSLLPVAAWQTVAKSTQPIWQILGLAADPAREYDVVGSVTVPIVAGGNILLEIEYKF
jgi:hypothetical protein